MMRLCVLVTARYNWRLDEVSIGHQELAQLWAVNDRTVKREMKRLTECGVLVCKRPGVRGRVGGYRLDYDRIYDLTRPSWARIGSDFASRMSLMPSNRTVVKVDFAAREPVNPLQGCSGRWGDVRRHLQETQPALFEAWFGKLAQVSHAENVLVLEAPNRFVAAYIETHLATKLAEAVQHVLGRSTKISLTAAS